MGKRENFIAVLVRNLSISSDEDEVVYLRKILDYAKEGEFSTYKRTPELVDWELTRLTTGISMADAAVGMGITEDFYNKNRKNLSVELYSVFGDNIFIELHQVPIPNHIKSMVDSIIRGFVITDIIPVQILSAVEIRRISGPVSLNLELPSRTFEVKDCLPEINFLSKYAIPEMEDELASLDNDKLQFLIDTLNGLHGVAQREGFLGAIQRKSKQFNPTSNQSREAM